MLRAVLFDMDETLIDWSGREGDWLVHNTNCLRPIYEHLQSAGHTVPSLEEVVTAYAEQVRTAWEVVSPPEWTCPRQIDILSNTLRALKIEFEAAEMERIQRLFGWSLVPGVRAFEDTAAVLKTLRAAGLKLGLITNADLPMWMRDAELKALGLLDDFEVRLTAGDVGRLKPHPAPFEEALNRLSIVADEAVMVGDRIEDDIAGAQSVGMRAVWIRRKTSEWSASRNGDDSLRPNATISRLSDLLNTLDLWFPGWRKTHEAESRSV